LVRKHAQTQWQVVHSLRIHTCEMLGPLHYKLLLNEQIGIQVEELRIHLLVDALAGRLGG